MYQKESDNCSSITNITVKYKPPIPVFLSHPHQHSSLPPDVRPHLGWDCNTLLIFLVTAVSVSLSVEVPAVNRGKLDQKSIISVEVSSVNSGYSDQRFIITCMSCRRMPAVIMTNAGLRNMFIFVWLSDSEMKIVE